MLYQISAQVNDIFKSKVVDHIAEVYVVGCDGVLRKNRVKFGNR